jgi:hypothetical protein
MGNAESATEESFTSGLLEHPQYTRPAEFRGWAVPEVLRSGDHGRIARWRLAAALHRTLTARPDLIAARGGLSDAEVGLLESLGYPGAVSATPPEEPDAPRNPPIWASAAACATTSRTSRRATR